MSNYSKILVTGGAGFIGSYIVKRLLEDKFAVIVLDNFYSGLSSNIDCFRSNSNFKFVKGDICDYDLVKNILRDVDVVFHEAALTDIIESMKAPLLTNHFNVTGTLTLLKACIRNNVKRFIYASSCAIYGDAGLQVREEAGYMPLSPYAASKAAAESYVSAFNKAYDLDTVILRYFNVYGNSQIRSSYAGVINCFINRLIQNKPPIVYGDGEQTRDFVHVYDVVRANMLALQNQGAVGETFNIGSGVAISINRLCEKLCSITGKENLKPVYKDARPGEVRHSSADITKAKAILGYAPSISINDGLISLVNEITQKTCSFGISTL
ncbi:MAG: SDR family NAD(P)-dependent oxidoreductase [Candidatus Jordarchaeaceae archaeon]